MTTEEELPNRRQSTFKLLPSRRIDDNDDHDDENIDCGKIDRFLHHLADICDRATTLGTFMTKLISCVQDTKLSHAEFRFVRNILEQNVGDFLRLVTADRNLITLMEKITCSSDINNDALRTFVEHCSYFKGTISNRRSNNDENDDDVLKLRLTISRCDKNAVDATAAATSNEQQRRNNHIVHRPFVTSIVADVVAEYLRRETIRDRSEGTSRRVRHLRTACRYDWPPPPFTEEEKVGCDEDTKVRDRAKADSLRAKIFNAYGRFSIVQPKLFVCRVDRLK